MQLNFHIRIVLRNDLGDTIDLSTMIQGPVELECIDVHPLILAARKARQMGREFYDGTGWLAEIECIRVEVPAGGKTDADGGKLPSPEQVTGLIMTRWLAEEASCN